MKKSIFIFIGLLAFACVIAFTYTPEKLMDPAKLATLLNTPAAKKPIILNVGPSAPLPGSLLIGNAEDPANKEKLKSSLKIFQRTVKSYCIVAAAN